MILFILQSRKQSKVTCFPYTPLCSHDHTHNLENPLHYQLLVSRFLAAHRAALLVGLVCSRRRRIPSAKDDELSKRCQAALDRQDRVVRLDELVYVCNATCSNGDDKRLFQLEKYRR
jgi:hypothetical protein